MKYVQPLLLVLGLGFTPIAAAQSSVTPIQPSDYQIQSSDLEFTRHNGTSSLNLARPDLASSFNEENHFDHGNDLQNLATVRGRFDFTSPDGETSFYVSPRFNKLSSNDAGLDKFSAEIRIGSLRVDEDRKRQKGWYIFAATDGEALSLTTRSLRGQDGPMTLSLDDQITIGDIQAGLSTDLSDDTQFTISYIETEASFSAPGIQSVSKREAFAGISLAKRF